MCTALSMQLGVPLLCLSMFSPYKLNCSGVFFMFYLRRTWDTLTMHFSCPRIHLALFSHTNNLLHWYTHVLLNKNMGFPNYAKLFPWLALCRFFLQLSCCTWYNHVLGHTEPGIPLVCNLVCPRIPPMLFLYTTKLPR